MATSRPPLAGKRIIVTGSSQGIGRAVAVRLAEEGARVVVNGRNPDTLEATLQAVRAAGGEAVATAGSVADYAFAGQLVESCRDHFGGVDGLINCAGIPEPHGSNIADIEPEAWRELINVHLHGTFNTCRQVAPLLVKQKSGAIINTSSHAFLGLYGGTGYAAGKGATNSLTLASAMDLREHGVRVNAICPGARTRLSSGEDYEALIRDLNRRGLLPDDLMQASLAPPDPAYVAPLYAFLVSDAAQRITGRIFWAAGGYIGLFHRNADQLVGFKNHETRPPWRLDEIEAKLAGGEFQQPEALFNVVMRLGPARVLVRQKLLLKLANTRLAQWLMKQGG